MSDSAGAVSPESFAEGSHIMDVALQAARQGAADASEAAVRVWSATGLFVSRVLYNTCYAVSYRVVFPTVLVAQSIPRNNAAVRGLIEGAAAANHRVEVLLSRSGSN